MAALNPLGDATGPSDSPRHNGATFLECSLDEACTMCTGETCALCLAGLTQSGQVGGAPCDHDVLDRHTVDPNYYADTGR